MKSIIYDIHSLEFHYIIQKNGESQEARIFYVREIYVERVKVSRFDECATVLRAPLQNCYYEAFESTTSSLSLRGNYAGTVETDSYSSERWRETMSLSHNLGKYAN